MTTIDVSVTLGDFNDPDVVARVPERAQAAIQAHGGLGRAPGSRVDFILACAGPPNQVRVCTESVCAQQPHRSQDALGRMYRRGAPPLWPSDHPLLLGRLALEVGTPRRTGRSHLGVASWNIMTQGITRPRRRTARGQDPWCVRTAREQARDVISVLDSLFAPGSGIDVICLQEAGGGRARAGSAGAWAEFFRPRALSTAVRERGTGECWRRDFEVRMIDGPRGLPTRAAAVWVLAKHARADAQGGHGIGSLTMVRSSALCLRAGDTTVSSRESELGEAAHACALPLLWSGGHRVMTHITNVHALREARPFTGEEVAASLIG